MYYRNDGFLMFMHPYTCTRTPDSFFTNAKLTKVFVKLDHAISICDSHFIIIDHQIPIGHNTLLQASRESIGDGTTIKKLMKPQYWNSHRGFRTLH